MMRRSITAALLGTGLLAAAVLSPGIAGAQQAGAPADVLITEEEARLPAPSKLAGLGSVTRSITRGPGIEQVSPAPGLSVASPMPLKIRFIARNNVAIDPASVKLIYLKAQHIDLTDRIEKYLTPDGIDMARAQVPPGTHLLQLSVKDEQGRTGTATVRLTVAP